MPFILQGWQRTVYKDTILGVYRASLDANGDTLGYALVTGTEDCPCNWHQTPNFEFHQSPAGMSKEVNIFTSDRIGTVLALDVRSEDLVQILDRNGKTEWRAVPGAPRRRNVLSFQEFYGAPTNAPTIVT